MVITEALKIIKTNETKAYIVNYDLPTTIANEHLFLDNSFTHNWSKNILKYSFK